MKKLSLLISLLFITFSCRTIREVKNFAQCEFSTTTIENMRLANINVQNVSEVSDINPLEITGILKSVSQKTLPLSFVVNISISNPNEKLAALNYLEWIAEIDNVEIAKGIVKQRYEIPSGGSIVMPLNVASDLYKIFSQKEGRELISKSLNVKDDQNKPKNLKLKVKPSISIGKGYVKYPGYITVKQKI